MDMNSRDMDGVATRTLLSDEEVVQRVREGDAPLFEVLMRRHNQRLYRVARSVVKDEDEAEDVVQQAYLNAFTHLRQFEARSKFTTWMTRITLNEAFARRRTLDRSFGLADQGPRHRRDSTPMDVPTPAGGDPERQAYAGELRRALEEAVDALPQDYRTVFILREVEGLSTLETGDSVGLSEDAVKTRLHRARAMIRRSLTGRLGDAAATAFSFPATRCDRVVAFVLEGLSSPDRP
jgi:RNA polymerase sigma-70 factor (ECF subfamily)